jgi:predicted O-methyltransferase YrrM
MNVIEKLNRLRGKSRMTRIKEGKTVPGIEKANALVNMVLKYYKRDFTVVEIGSYEGVSTEVFATFCARVISFDPYTKNDFVEQDGFENLARAEKIFEEVAARLGNITQYKLLSGDGAKKIGDGSIDAVYIDGNHLKDSVVFDIKTWYPKVRRGGVISGHDYSHTKKAVDTTIGEPQETFGSNWIIVKGSDGDKLK